MAHHEDLLKLVDSNMAMFLSKEEFRGSREHGMNTWRKIIRGRPSGKE